MKSQDARAQVQELETRSRWG